MCHVLERLRLSRGEPAVVQQQGERIEALEERAEAVDEEMRNMRSHRGRDEHAQGERTRRGDV